MDSQPTEIPTTRVRVPCIREPGWSRLGPGWHMHVFESRAELDAYRVLDRLRDPDDELRCPPATERSLG